MLFNNVFNASFSHVIQNHFFTKREWRLPLQEILDIPPPLERMNHQLHLSKPGLISASQMGLKIPQMINSPWSMEEARSVQNHLHVRKNSLGIVYYF